MPADFKGQGVIIVTRTNDDKAQLGLQLCRDFSESSRSFLWGRKISVIEIYNHG